VPAVERAAQVALLEGAAQVALLGRVAHTALLERAARPEQATRTALLVFSPPAAQAKTLSTPRVRALARAPIQAPPTNKFIRSWRVIIIRSKGEYLGSVGAPDRERAEAVAIKESPGRAGARSLGRKKRQLPPAGATVPPWLPAKSARVSNLLACCALGPPSCAAPCSCHHEAWSPVRQGGAVAREGGDVCAPLSARFDLILVARHACCGVVSNGCRDVSALRGQCSSLHLHRCRRQSPTLLASLTEQQLLHRACSDSELRYRRIQIWKQAFTG
jgi:hypothetical protein